MGDRLDRGGGGGLHLLEISHIALHGDRLHAELAELLDGLLRGLGAGLLFYGVAEPLGYTTNSPKPGWDVEGAEA